MCTVTLEYNHVHVEEIETHKAERDAFLAHSKQSMANVIARYQ